MDYDTELASAGGLLTFITLILICGFLTSILGYGIDILIATHNSMIGVFPTSQDSVNTGVNLVVAFKAMAFLLMLALGLNYLNTAQQETSGYA